MFHATKPGAEMHEFAKAAWTCGVPLPVQNQRTMRLFWLLLGLMVTPALSVAQSPQPPKVLILHSYHFGYGWT